MFNIADGAYQKFESYENFDKKSLNTIIDSICAANTMLCRHKYWTEKLWMQDRGIKRVFEEYQEADIKNAFIIYRLYKIGIYGMPIGITWFRFCSKEQCENFLNQFAIIFEDYEYWCDEQRAAEQYKR